MKRLLTVPEAAEILKIPTSWLYERSRHNALEHLGMVRVGKYLRFRQEAIEEYLERGGDKS